MSYQELFEKLEAGAWVLTANSRMARFLIKNYLDFKKSKSGSKICLSPRVMSLKEFCIQNFEGSLFLHPRDNGDFTSPTGGRGRGPGPRERAKILNPFESCLLWQKIIIKNTHDYALGLIQPESTAKSVHSAYESLLEANLELRDLSAEKLGDLINTPETLSFLNWAQEFEKICAEKYWMTEQGFFKRISESNNFPPLCPSISSFLDWVPRSSRGMTPQGERREQSHNHAQAEIVLAGFDRISPRLKLILKNWELENTKINIFKFSPKAQKFKLGFKDKADEFKNLAELAKNYLEQNLNNKNYKIGIVIPEIVSEREELIESFLNIFEPEKLRTLHPVPELFAVTGGEPLALVPIVFEGLELLKDKNIKNNNLGVLKKLADWRVIFLEILNNKSWPGEFVLSSFEHQAVLKFYQALENWMSLSFLVGEIDFESALNLLNSWLSEIFFQAESNKNAKVLIYGPLESAGLEHDVLLIGNMNSGVFPGQTAPNPFLPYGFQRAHELPHASALRELDYAKARLEDWAGLCGELIGSFREREGDLEQSPSALIEGWEDFNTDDIVSPLARPPQKNDGVGVNLVFARDPMAMTVLEYLNDFKAPEVSQEELGNLKSGIGIFKSQAACGFQAFAKFRLNLKPIDQVLEPLNLISRGIVTHEILEILMPKIFKLNKWKNLNSQSFKDLIIESVSQGLSRLQEKNPEALPGYFRELEFERLVNLMTDWIAFEQARPGFKLIAQEKKIFGVIGGINISGRVDRIDEIDQKTIIIDYKTGRVSALDWLSERPDEPQLPIYSLLLDSAENIAYAKINGQEIGLESLEDLRDFGDFETQKKIWLKSFENLAWEYLSGDARLNPKYGNQTCSRCDYLRLCRRHEV